MIDVRHIYWLAGLLEGEGSFCWNTNKGAAVISMHMTDRDVMFKVAELLGAAVYLDRSKGGLGHKPIYKLQMARVVDTIGWMMTLYPLLGSRRKEQIVRVLKPWRLRRGRPGYWLPAVCHSDQKRYAYGLCRRCYERSGKRKRNLRPEAHERGAIDAIATTFQRTPAESTGAPS